MLPTRRPEVRFSDESISGGSYRIDRFAVSDFSNCFNGNDYCATRNYRNSNVQPGSAVNNYQVSRDGWNEGSHTTFIPGNMNQNAAGNGQMYNLYNSVPCTNSYLNNGNGEMRVDDNVQSSINCENGMRVNDNVRFSFDAGAETNNGEIN